MCETCLGRLDRNPMRILDCKSPVCSKIADNAPKVLDFLCDECADHFEKVKAFLDKAQVEYVVNPTIVRGLDYYTKTVFEFVSTDIGAQATVCGGGRYDGLIEELGGQHMPSLGFALGIERLLMLLDAQGIEIEKPATCDIYFASMGENAQAKAFELTQLVRSASLYAECDVVGRGLRAQMKYADKIGAKFSIVIGDNEIEENKAKLKDMESGEQRDITLGDEFLTQFYDALFDKQNPDGLKI